jgi:hypothetical protein
MGATRGLIEWFCAMISSRTTIVQGVNLHHEPEECGKGHAWIVNITLDKVVGTIIESSKRMFGLNPSALWVR